MSDTHLPPNLQSPIPLALFEETKRRLDRATILLSQLWPRDKSYIDVFTSGKHPVIDFTDLGGGVCRVRRES